MAKLTSKDLIRTNLREGFDPRYYESLYRQLGYMLGIKYNSVQMPAIPSDGDHPDYMDLVVQFQEIGQSRRILNAQFHSLSRVMYSDPIPDFPQLDKWMAAIRKEFWRRRYYGRQNQMAKAYMEGDGVGCGFVEIGLTTNPETGYQRINFRHSPVLHTIWDRHSSDPEDSRFICFVKYLPYDDAEKMYGEKVAKKFGRTIWDSSAFGHTLRVVKIFEYYDIGIGGSDPTRAIIPENLANEPIKIEKNPHGHLLPFSYYIHFNAPMMRRPIGRIALQMSTQEALNDVERYQRAVLKQLPTRLIHEPSVNPEDVRAWMSGQMVPIRWDTPQPSVPNPVQNIAGLDLAVSTIQQLQLLERQFNSDSGTTDMDMGNPTAKAATLGENQILDARSQVNASWSGMQATRFFERTIEKGLKIAAMFDHDPMEVDVFGTRVPINQEDNPMSSIANFLKQDSQIVVSDDDLTKSDVQREQAARLAELQTLMATQLVGRTIDPTWFTEELLRAIGEENPQGAMMKQQPMAATPQQGVPVQGQQPAGPSPDMQNQPMQRPAA